MSLIYLANRDSIICRFVLLSLVLFPFVFVLGWDLGGLAHFFTDFGFGLNRRVIIVFSLDDSRLDSGFILFLYFLIVPGLLGSLVLDSILKSDGRFGFVSYLIGWFFLIIDGSIVLFH